MSVTVHSSSRKVGHVACPAGQSPWSEEGFLTRQASGQSCQWAMQWPISKALSEAACATCDAQTDKNLNSYLKGLLNKKHHTELVHSSKAGETGWELPRKHKAETLGVKPKACCRVSSGPQDSSVSTRLGCALEGPVFLSLHRSLTTNLTHLLGPASYRWRARLHKVGFDIRHLAEFLLLHQLLGLQP